MQTKLIEKDVIKFWTKTTVNIFEMRLKWLNYNELIWKGELDLELDFKESTGSEKI